VPPYAVRDSWSRPNSINAYASKPFPQHCLVVTLPSNETRVKNNNGALSGPCFQLPLRAPHERQPVLPTLFIPGFPKAATSWLWGCMHVAFVPEMICPRQQHKVAGVSSMLRKLKGEGEVPFDPKLWSKEGCHNRRYMLPGIACNQFGTCSHRKELFFYGSGFGNLFTAGLAALHGPQVPLELFQRDESKPRGVPTPQWDQMQLSRMETFCTSSKHTMLPDGRMHPACCVAEASNPRRWGCPWNTRTYARGTTATGPCGSRTQCRGWCPRSTTSPQ